MYFCSMKISRCLLTLALCMITVLCRAQNPKPADAAAVMAVLSEQQAAWNRADIEGFMKGYWHSDSLMFISSNGVTRGWQQTLDNYRKAYPGKAAMGTLGMN